MKLIKIPKHIWWGVLLPLVLVGLGMWQWWPEIERYRTADERKAVDGLYVICKTNHHYEIALGIDDDVEGKNTLWTKDVIGVFRETLKPQERKLAEADAAPLKPITPQPVPFHGYLFQTVDRENPPEPTTVVRYYSYSGNMERKMLYFSHQAFCAFPAVYDWRHRMTFIINEDYTIYAIDNGGKPVTAWPTEKDLAERFTNLAEVARQLYNPKGGE